MDLTGTKRIEGRCTASQIAAASVGREQACPVVAARASLHGDGARRQGRDEFVQLGARHRRAHQCGLARCTHPVDCKDVLGEIDADVDNGHGLPLLTVS
jgi:hypothetical protein